ncbi:2-hydroxychromene-2-carboxylate isomerase [Alloalcanivorax sp. C16-1]|uniref:2-hydroxychromene-2-carboxylate isomerase n=1 Tax=Alloalcanivorax sp. C16-1 TaxID=3390051 RepID=UPI003970F291
MAELEFWFDFASPYAYLAAETIGPAAAEAGVAVRWKPFLLGPIFQEQGWRDSPFNLFPAKGRYLWRDLQRETRRLGVPWQRPARFPFNSALATKTATWIEPEARLPAYCQALFRAGFAERRDPAAPTVVSACLRAAGLDDGPLERALAEEGGQRLRADVNLARERGIFGAPSFVVNGELYWGNERLTAALEQAWMD